MTRFRWLLSSVLGGAGVLLVLAGFVLALDVTPAGAVASVAAVAALLYAGALWLREQPALAAAPALAPVVFAHDGRAVTGPAAGRHLSTEFPEMLRPEIERRCAAALAGRSERFFCVQNGRPLVFDALPVRNADGEIVYGLLLVAEHAATTVGAQR